MRLSVLLRRARRLGFSSIFSLPRQLPASRAPTKHIKIDDEEQLLEDDQLSPRQLHPRAPGNRLLNMIILSLLILVVVLVFLAYIIYKPPKVIFAFLQWKNPDVLFQLEVPNSQRVVALTIDDAPSSETAQMLDLLKTYEAKATFFIIGSQVSDHPLLQRMHDEGHETGNHAWRDEPSIKLPLSELERQIKEVEELLPPNPKSAKYFRPGSGFFNGKMVDRLKSLGYRVVLGCIYPHDPQIHNPRINAAHVLSMVRPGGIIIMHDRRSYSSKQLELILKGLKDGGWNVVSLGGLLEISGESRGLKEG